MSVYGLLALNEDALWASILIFFFFLRYLTAALFGARLFGKGGMKPVLCVAGVVAALGFFAVSSGRLA